MAAYDPTRPGALLHAGTFNNNVLSMSAGIAGLTRVLTDEALTELNARGDRLRARGRNEIVPARHGPRLADDHPPAQRPSKQLLFFELLDAGLLDSPRRGMIALSLPITDEHCDAFAATRRRRSSPC